MKRSLRLLVRAVLDAQENLMETAVRVPAQYRDDAPAGMQSGADTLRHAISTHDAWVCDYMGGEERDAWPASAEALAAPFAEILAHSRRLVARATPILE